MLGSLGGSLGGSSGGGVWREWEKWEMELGQEGWAELSLWWGYEFWVAVLSCGHLLSLGEYCVNWLTASNPLLFGLSLSTSSKYAYFSSTSLPYLCLGWLAVSSSHSSPPAYDSAMPISRCILPSTVVSVCISCSMAYLTPILPPSAAVSAVRCTAPTA